MIDDRSVQRALAAAGIYKGPIDGDFGSASRSGARNFAAIGALRYAPDWPDARVRIAVEQLMMRDIGAYRTAIDGIGGPATQAALLKWQDWITFDRPPLADTALTHLPTSFPRQADALKYYGAPGTGHTRITPPYPVYYAGKQVGSILINVKCAESALRIMEDVEAEYGVERIHELQLDDFGGCFANRSMRNGTTLSTHALAAAWDWDADRNQLHWTSATAQMAKPDYRGFVDAHYRHGWISLGRERNFDWMHFQAVRL